MTGDEGQRERQVVYVARSPKLIADMTPDELQAYAHRLHAAAVA